MPIPYDFNKKIQSGWVLWPQIQTIYFKYTLTVNNITNCKHTLNEKGRAAVPLVVKWLYRDLKLLTLLFEVYLMLSP